MDAVYLVAGEDAYLREDALKTIKNKTLGLKKVEDFNYNIFYAGDVKVKDIIDDLRSLTFLNRKKLTLLRNFNRLSLFDKKFILKYSKNPIDSSILVLEVPIKTDLKKDVYKELISLCKFIDCSTPSFSSVSRWIMQFAKSRNKRISKDALELLIVNLGRDLNALDKAVEKLSLYADKRQDILREDVETLIELDVNYSAYNFTDAIANKNIQMSLKIIKHLVVNKNEAIKLLGRISWHFERILKAKKLLNEGISKKEICLQMGIPGFFIEKFIRQVGIFNLKNIKEVFKDIMGADLILKTKKTKPAIVLESLVFKIFSLR